MQKIIHIISSINRGGAENQMVNFINHSNTNKHFIITLLKSDELKEDIKDKNIEIFCLNLKENLLNKILLPFKLYKIIRKINSTKIFCWMYHACLISCCLKILLNLNIYWLIRHGSPFLPYVSYKNYFINYILAVLSYLIPNKIIYCSNYSLSQHQKFGYSKKYSTVIYNGYDSKKFYIDFEIKNNFKIKNNIPINYFIIGLLARFHKVKNHKLLFESLKILQIKYPRFKYKLLLAGRDINKENNQLIDLLKKNLIDDYYLFDKINNTYSFYNKLDLHVLPSINESFPNVVCESLLCGVDSLAPDVGASKEILINKKYILDKLEPEILAEKIYEYYLFYNKISNKNVYSDNLHKLTYERFNIQSFILNYNKII